LVLVIIKYQIIIQRNSILKIFTMLDLKYKEF
ncbi:hypothetical protein A5794_002087, partial [Enterococcus faecium]